MPSAERALVIFNPAAGRKPARREQQLRQLVGALSRGGWQVETAVTDPERGALVAAEAGLRSGCTVLVGCGGDGTLNQIANVIAAAGAGERGPALAVAPPWGTANVYAHALGCPPRVEAAAAWLLDARRQRRPLGRAVTAAGTRHFLAVAGVGYDAALVRDMSAEVKRRWGKLAFAASAVTAWRKYFPAPLVYTQAGRAGRADGILVGLTPYYAGRMKLGRPGSEGTIALALRGAPRLLAAQALWLLSAGLERAPGVERLGTGAITVTTPGLPLELDGEPAGTTPVELSVDGAGIVVLGRPAATPVS